jgi:hypothetical protein
LTSMAQNMSVGRQYTEDKIWVDLRIVRCDSISQEYASHWLSGCRSGLLQLGLVVLMVILIHAVEAYILNPVIYSGVYAVTHPS